MNCVSKILVSRMDRIVLVRIQGKGSFENSTALKDFCKEMICRGAREFILDLSKCPMMDSTFMGTLAAISLWLCELGEDCLSVVNLNERNTESLLSLGLDQLLNVRVSAIREEGQALSIMPKEDRTTRAQTMLEAHEALIKTAPESLSQFKDLIQYLKEPVIGWQLLAIWLRNDRIRREGSFRNVAIGQEGGISTAKFCALDLDY